MAYKNKSDATAYQNKFIAKAYDRVNLTMPKGKKEIVQACAEAEGESVNAYINKAIDQRMERDGARGPQVGAEGPQVGGVSLSHLIHWNVPSRPQRLRGRQ